MNFNFLPRCLFADQKIRNAIDKLYSDFSLQQIWIPDWQLPQLRPQSQRIGVPMPWFQTTMSQFQFNSWIWELEEKLLIGSMREQSNQHCCMFLDFLPAWIFPKLLWLKSGQGNMVTAISGNKYFMEPFHLLVQYKIIFLIIWGVAVAQWSWYQAGN